MDNKIWWRSVIFAVVSLLYASIPPTATAATQTSRVSIPSVNQPWSYSNLPPGYSWIAQKNVQTGVVVYYGLAPLNALPPLSPGETVYVGPDSVFYHFKHAPPIVPCDLAYKWSPNASPGPAVVQAAIAIPDPTPSASPSPNPLPATPPQYRYVIHPPQALTSDPNQARIFEIDLSDQEIASRGLLSVRVITSPNVNALYVHGASRTMVIPELTAGDFEFSGTIPPLPFFARGKSFSAEFEATTKDGCQAAVNVPFSIKR